MHWRCWTSRSPSPCRGRPGYDCIQAGMRHEMASVAMAESNSNVLGSARPTETWCSIWWVRTTAWDVLCRPLSMIRILKRLPIRSTATHCGGELRSGTDAAGPRHGGSLLAPGGTIRIPWAGLAGGDPASSRSPAERRRECPIMNEIQLTGLEGTNPLGFFAALGVQVAFASEVKQPRLWWNFDVTHSACCRRR